MSLTDKPCNKELSTPMESSSVHSAAELQRKIDELKNILTHTHNAWVEEELDVKKIASSVLSKYQVYGDSEYRPTTTCVVESLVREVKRIRAQRDVAVNAAGTIGAAKPESEKHVSAWQKLANVVREIERE